MTGLVRKATLLSAGGLLIAGAAMAGLPNQANSTIPTAISIFDHNANVSGSVPTQLLTIRDESNNPVPNAVVVFDVSTAPPSPNGGVGIQSNCADADVEICTIQPDPFIGLAGVTVGPGEVLTYTTDASGQLFVTIIGSGTNVTPNAAARPACVHIYAGSVFMGTAQVTATVYDRDGNADMNFFDGFLFLVDEPADPPTYNSRSDYDANGTINFFDGFLLLIAIADTTPWYVASCGGLVP